MDTSRVAALRHAKHTLSDAQCGIEQETIRITPKGHFAATTHPKAFGAPLTHPTISTDFGEQQLELITPPSTNPQAVRNTLKDLKRFIYTENVGELLWPLSMPPELPQKVAIAEYGSSFEAAQKTRYRKGLAHRYGEHMQLISGIHFNYSFPESFWELFGGDISENYLHITRNFLRYGWLVTYLYGASPTCHISFPAKGLQKLDPTTLYHPYATSLRMSPYGYYSRVQQQFAVSYNSVDEYVQRIQHGLRTHSKAYLHIKEQLSPAILQLENEHYARIRPKLSTESILKEGIRYLEIRSIDLDPFEPTGIGLCQHHFLTTFLAYCLVKESPPLTRQEERVLCKNQCEVALHGRAPHLLLQKQGRRIALKKWGHAMLDEIEQLATFLPHCPIDRYRAALDNPQKTLSGKIVSVMKEHALSHTAFGLHIAKKQQKGFLAQPLSQKRRTELEKAATVSINDLKRREALDTVLLRGYEDMELSTQCLLRECLKQEIHCEILDRQANILRLQQGPHKAYVRQVTKTALDSYVSAELMGNKEVTKKILREKKLRVADGGQAHSMKEASLIRARLTSPKLVVKPNTTNYGKGVHILDREDEKGFVAACTSAFSLDNTLVIEEFLPGTEYRFLVIQGKCVGIIEREPAHVIGDGRSTIAQLATQRNLETTRYRPPSEWLYLGSLEKNALQKKRLTTHSVLKKGRKVYLRENSNVSTGGDAIDRTDVMHPFYKKIAVNAAKAIGAVFCGVDMVVPDREAQDEYGIIELNYNPMIASHELPHKGTRRPIARAVLKALGFRVKTRS